MRSRLFILMLVVASMSGMAAYAHHSFAGTYIEEQTVKLEGTVAEFNIRNPHSFISIEVMDKDGKTTRWGCEWGGVTQLSHCLLYTSDAADERSSVDLGGRRIIKKKKTR